MKTFNFLSFVLLMLVSTALEASIPQRKGWWKFDDTTDLLQAEPGYPATLQLIGNDEAIEVPTIGNGAIKIGIGSYYKMHHLIQANGGGKFVNEYSLQFDINVPTENEWHALFQTNIANTNDGDFFINPSGNIGVSAVGYSGYALKPNEWYRMVVAVKNPQLFTVYLDGKILLEGNPQALDDRFSLESEVLLFADNDGEDRYIVCSEIAIWDQYLTSEDADELGGFGHDINVGRMALVPYLQSPGISSMVICWHDTIQNTPILSYGLTPQLEKQATATTEQIKPGYFWNTVNLEGLNPYTRYYYQLKSGTITSKIYSFTTLPDSNYQGKLRFVILGDTHSGDTTMPVKILKAARQKLIQLYGDHFEDSVQTIIHSGDVVVDGNSIDMYTSQYFAPMSVLSDKIATMVVAGNHEGESPYFYRYLKLDRNSAFPNDPNLNEKVWRLRVANTLYIGLNTNITSNYGKQMANWLNAQLKTAEDDSTIDFVFLVFHHPPFSELWYDVINFDGGPNYVTNTLFPIIKQYTKVQQIHYGHTHGLERGTITSDKPDGDFRIICGGGSGGVLDPWTEGVVHDYPEIHKTYSEYFFQLVEVDVAKHQFQNTVYSLGTLNHPKTSTILDYWYKKKNQSKPETPFIESATQSGKILNLHLSPFSGVDSLMSVQIRIFDEKSDNPLFDTTYHWQNIFGIDANGFPINKYAGLNMLKPSIPLKSVSGAQNLRISIRYRDYNLKWSDWSTHYEFKAMGYRSKPYFELYQNYPNPFNHCTSINYRLTKPNWIKLQLFNPKNQLIASIDKGWQYTGEHTIRFDGNSLSPGIYFYQLIAPDHVLIKEMVKY